MDYRSFVRQALAGHGLLGIVLGALVFQVCLTGALSVLSGELRLFEQPSAPIVSSASPEAFESLVREGYEEASKSGSAVIILGPNEQYPRLELRQPDIEDGYADASGAIIEPSHTPWTDFVTELHENLHLPGFWGSLIMGLGGVALLGSIISGVAAHSRIWRDLFRLRLRGSDRKREADLHNRTGVWGIPVFAVIALTGAYLSFAPMLGSFVEPLFRDQASPNGAASLSTQINRERIVVPPVAEIIRQVERENAPAKVSFVMLTSPGTPGQMLHVDTDVPRQMASGESYQFDAQGQPLGAVGYADGAVGLQIGVAMFPLHFGNFAGPPMRWIYFAIGLALCFLVATGMRIWFLRMLQQGTEVTVRWRVWSAFMWGQPLALALANLGTAANISPLLIYACLTIGSIGVGILPFVTALIRRALMIGTSSALATILFIAVDRHSGLPFTDPIFWLVFVLSMVFAGAALRQPRPPSEPEYVFSDQLG